MSTKKVTTKTSEQIEADFAAVFRDVKPAEPPAVVTQKERLAPYRKMVMKQRRRGFTWTQIAAGMRDPRIAELVSAKALKMLFGERPATSVQKPVRPEREHLILDPRTGERIVPGA